jgi:hypothetical protein
MLREAHKGLEVMGMVAGAVKDERWGDAERGLQKLQGLTGVLLRKVGDKLREKMMVPSPDKGNRG